MNSIIIVNLFLTKSNQTGFGSMAWSDQCNYINNVVFNSSHVTTEQTRMWLT